MNVGDYVRIINTLNDYVEIIKIKELNEYDGYLLDERNYQYSIDEIIKSSPQIIDLIEVGDLMYIDISPDNYGGIIVPRVAETENELNKYKEKINSDECVLKSIITHEQMEAMQYRVEE